MTFRAERYPKNWPEIRAAIRARAEERCECTGQCGGPHDGGRCGAPNGELIVRYTSALSRWRRHEHTSTCLVEHCGAVRIVLTVAHIDHDEQNSDPANLLALCQRCHLVMDGGDNRARRRASAAASAGQTELFDAKGRDQ